MSAEGQFLVGLLGFEAIREQWPDAGWVGGLTLGADPIAYAVAHRSWLEGHPLEAFSVRRKPKGHGAARRIEGGLPRDARVVVVEDTFSSGASALEAVAAVQDEGGRVLGVVSLVDREMGAAERIRQEGVPTLSLFTAGDLVAAAGGPSSE
jgi:orotate phosphoribosyltransferase